MGFYDAIRVGAAGATGDFTVNRSLRFNKSEYHYLTRTPSSTGNQKVWTFSAWIKRTNLANNNHYIYSANNSNSAYFALYFQNDNLYSYFDPGNNYGVISDREFRDVGAWFHLVHQVDAANTTQRIWINGEELSLNSGRNPGNSNYPMNQSGIAMVVGTASWWLDNNAADMYLAEVHYSDGNKYEPSDFAETNSETGQWIPKSPSISYGTNGFYLNFSDNSGTTATTLGKDSSGNGNNFTPTNFSVATWPDTDSVEDTPTNNFCTLNFLDKNSNVILANGNLQTATTATSGHYPVFSTMSMKGGKWYVEAKLLTNDGFLGSIMNIQHDGGSLNIDSTVGNPTSSVNKVGYGLLTGDGRKSHNGTYTSYGSAISGSDIWMCAFDADNGKIYWGKNGTFFASGDPAAGSNAAFTGIDTSITWNFAWHHYGNNNNVSVNFGQQGFTYTPPTGFKALNSANLPAPTILLPNKHFDTLLWDGDSANSRDITGLNFKPDWVWIKSRNYSSYGGGLNYNHVVWDTLRGVGSNTTAASGRKELTINENYIEGTTNNYTNYYGHVSAFNNNGFTLGKISGEPALFTNLTGRTYVGWNWNAGETDGKTYTVKVVSDSGNKYRFDNFGTSAVTLDLAEGGTYIFNMDDSSNASHPFSIGTAANGTVYTSGITYFLDGVSKTYSQYTSGFSAASTRRLHITVPASAPQLYYWCSVHSGMGGAINTNTTLGSSNFDGNNQSTVKASPTAGFSIVSYVGNGVNNSNVTMGHGLGVAPDAVILKNRDTSPYGAKEWVVWHQDVGTDGTYVYKNLSLNTTGASSANSDQFRNVDANTIQVRSSDSSNGKVNANNNKYIAYVFSEVEGYSKFGSYVGNGSDDGSFVFLGFRPALIIIKRTDSSSGANWLLLDDKRNTFNVVNKNIYANLNNAEADTDRCDFLANGFKLRQSGTTVNTSGGVYIYLAFAESPFRNARAR